MLQALTQNRREISLLFRNVFRCIPGPWECTLIAGNSNFLSKPVFRLGVMRRVSYRAGYYQVWSLRRKITMVHLYRSMRNHPLACTV